MRPVDYAKAFGLGVAALALSLLLLVAIMVVYGQLVAPGLPQAHYSAMAPKIGNVSAPLGGMLLMFAIAWGFGRRRPQRNAVAFGLSVFAAYAVVDTAMGLAMAPPAELLRPPFIAGMLGSAIMAFAGGFLARKQGG